MSMYAITCCQASGMQPAQTNSQIHTAKLVFGGLERRLSKLLKTQRLQGKQPQVKTTDCAGLAKLLVKHA
eukprot:scaffold4910_cov20-Tisochrysis_lutea.AAC.1